MRHLNIYSIRMVSVSEAERIKRDASKWLDAYWYFDCEECGAKPGEIGFDGKYRYIVSGFSNEEEPHES